MSATVSYTQRAIRAWPTLLKVSFAEAVAYRAEFIVWILTTTMPFVNMALMTAVARGGAVAGYDGAKFAAYYLAVLLVRMLTGAWVVWEMNQEIRQGTMSARLLRPIHPVVSYASDNLAAMPLRGLIAIPLVLALLFMGHGFTSDPALLVMAPVAIALAWALNFLIMCAIGTVAFFTESGIYLFEVWLQLWMLFSGYFLPLDLYPRWVVSATSWLPFRVQIDLPVRILLGDISHTDAAAGIGIQLAWIALVLALVFVGWRAGLKRFQAYGG